jgi:HEAT repeats
LQKATKPRWRADANHNQLIAVTNSGQKSADALLTLHYDNGAKRYEMEQTIPSGEQTWVNLADLIHNRVADRKGNTLPVDVNSVTYDLRNLTPRSYGLMVNALSLDATLGSGVQPDDGTCCGYSGVGWNPDTFELVIDGTDFGDITGVDSCGGGNEDISPLFNSFASASAAIATVASPGTVSGVSAGTTTASATGVVFYGAGDYCTAREVEVTAPVTVQPTITGGNTVWWFNGQNPDPTDYPTSITLTSSAGSSTSWSVTQNDAKVNLSSTSGDTVTVTSTGAHFSASSGDITITATASDVASAPFTVTARTPWKLVPVSINTFCNSSPLTYSTEITYNVIDNLSATMSSDIFWNEAVGTLACANGSNWCRIGVIRGGGDSNPVTDILSPPSLNASPAPSPTPVCNAQGTGTTLLHVSLANNSGRKRHHRAGCAGTIRLACLLYRPWPAQQHSEPGTATTMTILHGFVRQKIRRFFLWCLCGAALASACYSVGVPNLKIAELVASSDVIVIAQVYEVRRAGPAAPISFRGASLAADAYVANLEVLLTVKGPPAQHLSVKYGLPTTFAGYQGLRQGTRMVFLRKNGSELSLADPYHPDLPAASGDRLATGTAGYAAVVQDEMLAVIASPSTTASEKSEVLRFDYTLPNGPRTIDALRRGLINVGEEDLRQRIEGELIRLGETSELPDVVSLLLRNSATSNRRLWLLYVLGNSVTDPLAIPALQPLLESTDNSMREAAAQALWRIASPIGVPSLARALEDPDESVRFYAVRGCADIAREPGWGGPGESEFQEHEQQYLAHWRSWAKTYQPNR